VGFWAGDTVAVAPKKLKLSKSRQPVRPRATSRTNIIISSSSGLSVSVRSIRPIRIQIVMACVP
jgi:hypothetical protein